MEYTPIVLDASNNEVVKLGFTEESLQKIEAEYMSITLADHMDAKNYEIAKAAHIRLKGLTSSLEENKKAITKEYREKTNYVNGIANKIKARLEGVKDHLATQRAIKEDYEKRIKEEAERAEQERIDFMTNQLAEYDASLPLFKLCSLTEEQFKYELDLAKESFEVRQETKRLEAERIKKLEADNKKLQAEVEASRKVEREKQRLAEQAGLLEQIKEEFPTLELAWNEIYKLKTEVF